MQQTLRERAESIFKGREKAQALAEAQHAVERVTEQRAALALEMRRCLDVEVSEDAFGSFEWGVETKVNCHVDGLNFAMMRGYRDMPGLHVATICKLCDDVRWVEITRSDAFVQLHRALTTPQEHDWDCLASARERTPRSVFPEISSICGAGDAIIALDDGGIAWQLAWEFDVESGDSVHKWSQLPKLPAYTILLEAK